MRRLAAYFGVVFAFWMIVSFSGCSSIKSYDDLSAVQVGALQESNERLDAFDKQLMELDDKLAKGKIHVAEYKKRADELTSLIAEESQFQNAILIKDPKIKVMAQHLLDNIQKAIEETPVIAETIALVALRSLAGATITP
ncbi:MAG: hypothetical protein LV480_11495 [Methylacidiphilales bacterium]|nr:hypothetical protein [Candidatus Methylacidiphilales bacterium]